MAKSTPREQDFTEMKESRLTAPQSNADGISGFMLGIPLSKIFFHNALAIDDESGKEMRKISLIVSIPTPALIEFCQNTLEVFERNTGAISDALDDYKSKTLLAASPKTTPTTSTKPKPRRKG